MQGVEQRGDKGSPAPGRRASVPPSAHSQRIPSEQPLPRADGWPWRFHDAIAHHSPGRTKGRDAATTRCLAYTQWRFKPGAR